MKLIFDKERMQEALSVLGGTVPTQATSPVLLDVLIKASSEDVLLSATDMNVFLELRLLEAEVADPGQAAIPFSRFSGLIREIEGDRVTLSQGKGEHSVRVEAENDRFTIVGHRAEEFPEAPERLEVEKVKLDWEPFVEGLRSVAFAAGKEPARQQMQGVALTFMDKKLILTATDGRRLAEYTLSVGQEFPKRIEGRLPPRAVESAVRLLSFVQGEVLVGLDPQAKQFVLEHERGSLVSRLLEGQLPDYQSMIPTEFEAVVEGPARELLKAVRKVSVLTTKDQSVVFLEKRGDEFKVRVDSQEVGFGEVPVAGMEARGEDVSLAFQGSFLMEGLRVFGDKNMKFGLIAKPRASVMWGGRNFRYAVMPVVMRAEAV